VPSEARSSKADCGFVTAETAVLMPVLVALMAVLVWAVLVGAAQIRCVDAAREAARAAARGDPPGQVLAVARAAAPAGAVVAVSEQGADVRVVVSARSNGPGTLGGLLSLQVSGSASALREVPSQLSTQDQDQAQAHADADVGGGH
jgi:TadE-like protein